MPVVIAARLSLSFPILISAVPICAVDYTRPPGKMRLVVHWFSDGGISSNFPMHLFDSMWPRRPTFGIALDVTLAELSLEAFLPADEATAAALRASGR